MIEGVDAENRSRYRRRNFPAEKLLAKVVRVGHRDANYRMPRFFERGDLRVLCRVGCGFQANIGKDAVVAINIRRRQLFAIDRDDALAQLAGGLSNQLLEPCSQVRNAERRDHRDFVAAHLRGRSEDHTQPDPWILRDRNIRLARLHHLFRAIQKLLCVEAHDSRRDHAKIRQRRIASADGGKPVKNVAEAIAFSDLLHLRAGIGDCNEAVARFVGSQHLLHAFKKILFVDVGFERAARFARNNEESFREIDFCFRVLDLRGVGGIEYVEPRKAGLLAESEGQNLRAKARSAHPEEQDVAEASALYFGRQFFELANVRQLLLSDVEPSQPGRFVFARPERLVVIPETFYFVAGLPVAKVFFYRTVQIGRQTGTLWICVRPTRALAVLFDGVQ